MGARGRLVLTDVLVLMSTVGVVAQYAKVMGVGPFGPEYGDARSQTYVTDAEVSTQLEALVERGIWSATLPPPPSSPGQLAALTSGRPLAAVPKFLKPVPGFEGLYIDGSKLSNSMLADVESLPEAWLAYLRAGAASGATVRLASGETISQVVPESLSLRLRQSPDPNAVTLGVWESTMDLLAATVPGGLADRPDAAALARDALFHELFHMVMDLLKANQPGENHSWAQSADAVAILDSMPQSVWNRLAKLGYPPFQFYDEAAARGGGPWLASRQLPREDRIVHTGKWLVLGGAYALHDATPAQLVDVRAAGEVIESLMELLNPQLEAAARQPALRVQPAALAGVAPEASTPSPVSSASYLSFRSGTSTARSGDATTSSPPRMPGRPAGLESPAENALSARRSR